MDGVLVGRLGSFWTTRRTSSRNRAAAREQRELDRLSSIGCRAATSGLSPDQKCKPLQDRSDLMLSPDFQGRCWLRARIRGAAVIEAPLTRQSLVRLDPDRTPARQLAGTVCCLIACQSVRRDHATDRRIGRRTN